MLLFIFNQMCMRLGNMSLVNLVSVEGLLLSYNSQKYAVISYLQKSLKMACNKTMSLLINYSSNLSQSSGVCKYWNIINQALSLIDKHAYLIIASR